MAEEHFPVAFYFQVQFSGEPSIDDTAFAEVSGIALQMETEEVREGGENEFTHRLPLRQKHGNLILKRALMPASNALEKWVTDTLEGGFARFITTRNISVSLMDSDGVPLCQWFISNAFPVRWQAGAFDARKNELAVETLEICYNTLQRKA